MTETYRPTNGAGLQTAQQFREATKVGKEFIFDRPIVDIWNAGPNYTTTDGHWSVTPGTGHPTIADVNSSGIIAPVCNANSEGITTLWKLPDEIDVAQEIDVRLLTCNVTDAAGAGTETWTVVYKALVAGTTAVGAASTALGTTIEATTNLAQYVATWSTWGVIAAATSGITTLVPGDDALIFKATVALSSVTDSNPLIMQARYYRKYLGSNLKALW